MTITAPELFQLLMARYPGLRPDAISAPPPDWQILDGEYGIPSRRWVEREFAAVFRSNLFRLGISDWHQDVNDCDKFARYTWALAAMMHARSPGRVGGLAVGWLAFQFPEGSNMGLRHALNLWVVPKVGIETLRDTSDLEVIEWEPQTLVFSPLTPQERESIVTLFI